MKTKYKVVFKMAGGTIIKVKEFVQPAGVIYCATQDAPDDANEVQIENLETGGIASYELNHHQFPRKSLDGLKAFVGGV